MRIKLDVDVNALSIAFRDGTVARTIEIADRVFADFDENGDPIGLKFVSADDSVPFMRDHAGDASVPPKIREMLGAAA